MKKQVLAAAVVFLLVGAAAYGAFFVAPTERTMGPIQRIFYLHVCQRLDRPHARFSSVSSPIFFTCFAASRNGIGSAFPPRKWAWCSPRWCWSAGRSGRIRCGAFGGRGMRG